MVGIDKQYRWIMDGENQVFDQALVMFLDETLDRQQKVADHVNGRQLNRCQVFDIENGKESCQLNLQVLWLSITSRSMVRLHWPLTMFETITLGSGVQRKKQTPRNCHWVQTKKHKLKIVTGELNAQFERFIYYII